MVKIKYIDAERIETKKDLFSIAKVREEMIRQNALENIDKITGLVITHTFENLELPIKLDSAFLFNRILNECVETLHLNMTIRGCFNYGLKFHTQLWQGYNHLALIEFENEIPMESYLLASDHEKTVFHLILCSKEDVADVKNSFIENRICLENFMKEKNSDIYETMQIQK